MGEIAADLGVEAAVRSPIKTPKMHLIKEVDDHGLQVPILKDQVVLILMLVVLAEEVDVIQHLQQVQEEEQNLNAL